MTTEQQTQAQHLYFQSGMSRKDIAAAIGVTRPVLYSWIDQQNWYRIRASARSMPSIIADNCYQVLGNLTTHLLSDERVGQPVTIQEANSIFKITATIQKLKNMQTVSESMETFAHFTEHLAIKDAALAEKVAPHIDEFIAIKAAPQQAVLPAPISAETHSKQQAPPVKPYSQAASLPTSPRPPLSPLPAAPVKSVSRTDNPAPPPGKVPRIMRSAA